MPEMSGMEFLKALNEEGISVPFGFITTEGTPEMKQKAIDEGAVFLITKPFTAETFNEQISVLIS